MRSTKLTKLSNEISVQPVAETLPLQSCDRAFLTCRDELSWNKVRGGAQALFIIRLKMHDKRQRK